MLIYRVIGVLLSRSDDSGDTTVKGCGDDDEGSGGGSGDGGVKEESEGGVNSGWENALYLLFACSLAALCFQTVFLWWQWKRPSTETATSLALRRRRR